MLAADTPPAQPITIQYRYIDNSRLLAAGNYSWRDTNLWTADKEVSMSYVKSARYSDAIIDMSRYTTRYKRKKITANIRAKNKLVNHYYFDEIIDDFE